MRRAPSVQSSERLDGAFYALSDAKRRAMLDRLSRGPASVTELAEPMGMPLPSASKHLALLEKYGLVKSGKTGRVRTYHMPRDAFGEVEHWLEQRKAMWNRHFDRLDEYLAETSVKRPRKRRV